MTSRKRTLLVLALLLGSACFLTARQAADGEVKIGDKVGNLTFKDTHYLPRSLDDFDNRKAFVLVFTTTSCPVVQRYLPTLGRLEKEYRDRGVQFLALNVGPDDSVLDVATQAAE